MGCMSVPLGAKSEVSIVQAEKEGEEMAEQEGGYISTQQGVALDRLIPLVRARYLLTLDSDVELLVFKLADAPCARSRQTGTHCSR